MEIFASFIHRRFIMAHFVQEAFILIMVLIFLSKLRSFLGLWQNLCHYVWAAVKFIQDGREYFSSGFACVSMTACSGVHDGHPDIILLRKMVPTSVWQLLKLLDKFGWGSGCSPGARNSEPGVRDLHHLGACGSFFSGHSGFSSAIIQLGFTAFTEWIGILSSDVPVVVMDPTRILCFGGGVSEFTLNVSREAAFHRPVLHL